MRHRGVQEVQHPTPDIVKVLQTWLSQTSYPIHRRIKSQVSCWPSVRCSKGSPRSSQEFWRFPTFWFPCALERSANETLSRNKKKKAFITVPIRLLSYRWNENISAVFSRPSRRISGKQRDHLGFSFLQRIFEEEKHPRTHFCPWKYCEIVFSVARKCPITVRRGAPDVQSTPAGRPH